MLHLSPFEPFFNLSFDLDSYPLNYLSLISFLCLGKSNSPFPFTMIGTVGVTGLSLKSLKDNWSSDYQNTNNAGIPDPAGTVSWNFK